jgi:hypothetical protein
MCQTDIKFISCISTFYSLLTSSYEKKPSEDLPTMAGYATAYPFHYHQIAKGMPNLSEETFYEKVFKSSAETSPTYCRLRLSQFIIFPPFQHVGHGGKFYDAIFQNAREDPLVQEISIEDPSNPFEDLRDRRDLAYLESLEVFKGIELPAPKQWIEETRKKHKIPVVFSLPFSLKCRDNFYGFWKCHN